ncbi:MAG: glycosyltransferase family 1 protein, partial [Lachnospiraceae bacterium]|nr:glycosyltransferase family 1 protein [Lachnospiraceae bacterium]
ERKKTLQLLADFNEAQPKKPSFALYTPDASFAYPGIANKGTVDYGQSMAEVFFRSKINLNITLRSIHSGIPLRCFDIIASGGFLLSNYQSDFPDCFTPGQDFVAYDDLKQLPELAEYYLSHEREREEIAENGLETLRQHHTYQHRVQEMLAVSFE